MIGILKKIVVNLGGVDVSQKNYETSHIENLIQNTKGEKIAEYQNCGIWIQFTELNNYYFLDVNVIGNQSYKSFNGSELIFYKDNEIISILNSDTREIESISSNISNRNLTEISFDITTLDIDFIKNKKFDKIIFKCQKKKEEFKVI